MQNTLYLNQWHKCSKMDTVNNAFHKGSEHSIEKTNKHKSWRSRVRYFLKMSSSAKKPSSNSTAFRLTADDVTEWAQSFEKLLSHKYGKAAFQVFLKSEFCEENMEFWLACEEFRKIQSPTKLSLRATSIYEEFIKSESPKEVNLDFYTKDAIIQNIQLPTHFCFVAAQKKIYNLMENSSYPRFIDSHIYRELHAATQREGKHFRT
ncbi:hypothetical protein AGOR_G00144630 [Albula goreensis]|uniref:RGS domain-containing protein n=1 Tax=Albula goreensis TaxID=1534307 RepID=A0A8T3D9L6_9TELE|nr:hypothetical protein AGOR_G00144630 [Albula goreensis]